MGKESEAQFVNALWHLRSFVSYFKNVHVFQGKVNSDSMLKTVSLTLTLVFAVFVIISIHNGLSQRILSLCLTVKLKCLCGTFIKKLLCSSLDIKNKQTKTLHARCLWILRHLWCWFCSGLRNFMSIKNVHGERNGTPLQYSCLENPMDGEAW